MAVATPTPGFTPIDVLVLVAYVAVVLIIGWRSSRRPKTADDFFLGSHSMPLWAVAISILATSQSAATFVGGPQQAFDGNLTYLMANVGSLLAVIAVAVFFIPRFYRLGVTSVYELVGHSFGLESQRLASAMFLIGRVFASGARLFIVALPFSLITFGDIQPSSLVLTILFVAILAMAYTMMGGIRAVIWTDVLQTIVYIGAVVIALLVLWNRIPASPQEILEALRTAEGGDKLHVLEVNPANTYSIWAIVIGFTLFNMAAYGTDQDLTQRMLTCSTAREGSWSVIVSTLISWPIVLLFLVLGLLLHVFYTRPDLMGAAAPAYAPEDSRRVFLEFILHEMPVGIRGLMMAGLLAAAMSSMDSALNAMSSATIADFFRPAGRQRTTSPEKDANAERRLSRICVAGWAAALAAFAIVCVYWQQASGESLIDFALGVMVFAYAGLLAVFLAAIFTNRGNAVSVAAALVFGFLCVLGLQNPKWFGWLFADPPSIAFPWQMAIATSLSFGICCALPRSPQPMTQS